MGTGHADFADLLDHLAGRVDPAVAAHLDRCTRCAADARGAARLLAAGRGAAASAPPSRRAMARAMAAFRGARGAQRPSALRLVLDSLLRPAPAVRGAATEAARFLRFEGAVTLELQITPAARGVDLRGQLTPKDFAARIALLRGARRRRATVADDGTFLVKGVPRGECVLEIGTLRVVGLLL